MEPYAYLCPKCKTPNPKGITYCVKCGHWLLDTLLPAVPLAEREYQKIIRNGYTGEINSGTRGAVDRRSSRKSKRRNSPVVWLSIIALICWFAVRVYGSLSSQSSSNAFVASPIQSNTDRLESPISNTTETLETTAQPIASSDTDAIIIGESFDEYEASCLEVKYADLCRYPDKYEGKRIVVKGEVNHYSPGTESTVEGFHVYEDYSTPGESGDSWYEKQWFITYTQPTEERILKKDLVEFYGEYAGLAELISSDGNAVQVPELIARYHVITSAK